METRNILISDFDYDLPDEKIALHPLQNRDRCKLLVSRPDGTIHHNQFFELPALLNPGSLMIVNETKVIKARMEFFKSTGSRIEIFLLEPFSPSEYVGSFASSGKCTWLCMVGNLKRWKSDVLEKSLEIPGISVPVILQARLGTTVSGNSREVIFTWNNPDISFATIVEHAGNIPIPPYLKRSSEDSDTEDYQTVYSHTEGSVAAPTAGLHFTPELMNHIRKAGVEIDEVTLHVGAGTFQPVKSEQIGEHPMHEEWISVSRSTIINLIDALKCGREIVAVGTTSVRTLESLPYFGVLLKDKSFGDDLAVTQWMPYIEEFSDIRTVESLERIVRHLDENGLDSLQATTSIMIAPGFKWRIVNRLITNFHQPKSTLLLLVSSFLNPNKQHSAEKPQWKKVYEEALKNDYRFLSYGDACLFSSITGKTAASIELPLSKSMALRQAVIDFQCSNVELRKPGQYETCDDIDDLINALNILKNAPDRQEISVRFRLGAAPVRFFIAMASSVPGRILTVDADEHLKKRPIAPLINALRQAGASIECLEKEGTLPLRIKGKKLEGGMIDLEGNISSQFLSAVLLVAPSWKRGATINISLDKMVSASYAEMTLKMMSLNGVTTELKDDCIIVSPSCYIMNQQEIEPDWSAAAFFYETALLLPETKIKFRRLVSPTSSLQGDKKCLDIFRLLGVNTRFEDSGSAKLEIDPKRIVEVVDSEDALEFDLSSTPDIAPALAVAMALRGIPFLFKGTSTLRKKESNRVETIQTGLKSLGFILHETADTLSYYGEKVPKHEMRPEIHPHADHRIAMAFAPAEALGLCVVADKAVVSKSFPYFWQIFGKLNAE